MGYELRLATIKDLNIILDMSTTFLTEESPYQGFQVTTERMKETIQFFLTNQDHTIILGIDEENNVCGMLAAGVVRLPFSDQKMANEVVWWVYPEHRKGRLGILLFQAFEYWAKEVKKCTYCQTGSVKNKTSDSVLKFYNKKGYEPSEFNFVKRIQ